MSIELGEKIISVLKKLAFVLNKAFILLKIKFINNKLLRDVYKRQHPS